jgi:hypothetical protein
MGEQREMEVLGIAYVGPHCVHPESYEIVIHVQAAPNVPAEHIALRFRPSDAAFLALAMQSNPPRPRADERLRDHVAALGT